MESLLSKFRAIGDMRWKETHFWDDFSNRGHTLRDYTMNFFPKRLKEDRRVVFGDFTPRTVWHSDEFDLERELLLPKRVHSVLPNAKLIVLVRNPVDRLLSDFSYYFRSVIPVSIRSRYFHNRVVEAIEWWNNCTSMYSVRHCVYGHHFDLTKMTPLDVVNCDNLIHVPHRLTSHIPRTHLPYLDPHLDGNSSIVHRRRRKGGVNCDYDFNWRSNAGDRLRIGLYHVHIREWLKHFPRDQLLVLKFEENIVDTDAYVTQVLDFLKVKDRSLLPGKSLHNTDKHSTELKTLMWDKTRKVLEDFYRPHNQELAQLLQDDKFLWQ